MENFKELDGKIIFLLKAYKTGLNNESDIIEQIRDYVIYAYNTGKLDGMQEAANIIEP